MELKTYFQGPDTLKEVKLIDSALFKPLANRDPRAFCVMGRPRSDS